MARKVRVVIATGVFSAIVAMMAESLAYVIYRLDEWVDGADHA